MGSEYLLTRIGFSVIFFYRFIYKIIQIIKAGTVGECLFFIASGSVCITSTNGQALFHLEDGDYFGEIAFILRNRKVTEKNIDHKFDKK